MTENTNIEAQHHALVVQLLKPAEDLVKTLTPDMALTLHMTLGVVGEAIEVRSCLHNGNALDVVAWRADLLKELGDVAFYLRALCMDNEHPDGVNVFSCTTVHLHTEKTCPLEYADEFIVACGDFVEFVKKQWAYARPINLRRASQLRQAMVRKFLRLLLACNVSVESVLECNVRKLKARFPEGYSDSAAIARVDQKSDADVL